MSSRQLIVTLLTTNSDTGICRETLEKLCQLVGKDEEGVINQALALYARVMFPAYDPNDSDSFNEEQLSMIQNADSGASMKVTKSIFKP
jgi:hypothetical protein